MNRAIAMLHDLSRQPWAIESAALQRLIAQMSTPEADRIAGFAPSAGAPAAAPAAAAPNTARGKGKGVSVIQINGPIVYRWGRAAYWYGCCNADDIARAVAEAAGSEDVGTIVLYMNSPGGTCWGVPEVADAVFAARETKKVIAVADPLSASACYWIGSQASEFWVVPSGDVGSIGVFMLHMDWSKYLEIAGIKPTFIFSAEYKVEGNPLEPLTEEAKARFQLECDAIYDQFLAAVARGRGVSVADVRAKYGKGRCLQAKEAKAAGMVDKIGSYPAMMSRLGVQLPAEDSRSSALVLRKEADGGIWVVEAPDPARFSAELLAAQNDPAVFSVSGDRITIAGRNMTVAYDKIGEAENGDWLCRVASVVHHVGAEPKPAAPEAADDAEPAPAEEQAPKDGNEDVGDADLVDRAAAAAVASRAAARAREISLAQA